MQTGFMLEQINFGLICSKDAFFYQNQTTKYQRREKERQQEREGGNFDKNEHINPNLWKPLTELENRKKGKNHHKRSYSTLKKVNITPLTKN